ncbi:tetratricopeptide repeat protein [Rufibacter roseus]|uniref:Tetratricopeptide repeat protein n=1 Tax=Rufibacter roseus TaxID=1567108 RepID=A0ABW2DU29_9BACT|nr:tetratricopeptide repeat protein [Rufibacter roseus]
MRVWWLIVLFSFSPLDGLQRIALRNQYAQQAQQAYQTQQYQLAATLYEKIRQQDGNTPSQAVQFNLAHSYFHLHDYSKAAPLYRALLKVTSNNNTLSVVATQLALIEAEEGNFLKAVELCKQALKADETNQEARYNYELLQKYLILHPEKLKTPPPPPRKPDQGKGGTQSPNQKGTPSNGASGEADGLGGNGNIPDGAASSSKTGANGPEQEQAKGDSPGNTRSTGENGSGQNATGQNGRGGNQAGTDSDALLQTRFERLKKLQLSPEKARQLLDAMRQEEAQYLQQLPRRRTRKANDDGPDW